MIYCVVIGCPVKAFATNLCKSHYASKRKYGDPLIRKHGRHGGHDTPEFKILGSIRGRCNNPNDASWANYGGRGIKITRRWMGVHGYENFINDMGTRPSPTHSIDRINVNGNYSKANCRWATRHQQAANTTRSLPVVGVYKYTNRYQARLMVDGSLVLNERFDCLEDAINARKSAELRFLKSTG